MKWLANPRELSVRGLQHWNCGFMTWIPCSSCVIDVFQERGQPWTAIFLRPWLYLTLINSPLYRARSRSLYLPSLFRAQLKWIAFPPSLPPSLPFSLLPPSFFPSFLVSLIFPSFPPSKAFIKHLHLLCAGHYAGSWRLKSVNDIVPSSWSLIARKDPEKYPNNFNIVW